MVDGSNVKFKAVEDTKVEGTRSVARIVGPEEGVGVGVAKGSVVVLYAEST